MKKKIFGIIIALLYSLHFSVFPQQDVKSKSITDSETSSIEVVLVDSNRLSVRNAPVGKKLQVFSIVGNKVKEIEIKSPSGEYTLNLPRSIYIVKLDTFVGKYVIK